MKNIIIIYHGDCFDGFGGAWAAWKRFGDAAEYFGVKNSDKNLPGELKDKEIYLIDFTYPEAIVRQLLADNKKVTAIDHHISSEPVVKLTSDYSFDLNHSGAVLAWQYFHQGEPVPALLRYIEDTDLWRFQLPKSKEISEYIHLHKKDFSLWDALATDFEGAKFFAAAVGKGAIVLLSKQGLVDTLVENYADVVEFEGMKIYAANAPSFFASDLGHALAKILPPMAIVWSQRRGKKVFSLRSDGTVDVSKIAQKYGGGGHPAASGFALNADEPLPWQNLDYKS